MARRYNTIVIDTGTSTTKAGFASDIGPRLEIPTLVGVHKPGSGGELIVGTEANSIGDRIDLIRPVNRGIVANFSQMTDLWSDILYRKLGVSSLSEYAVFLTDRDLNPKANKERSTQIFFEEFQVAALSFGITSVCSIVGSGRLCGTAVDLGGGTCMVTPVQDGYSFPHATRCLHLAGNDITEYLMNILNKDGKSVISSNIAQSIKERMAYISPDSQIDNSLTMSTSYALPDGQLVAIGGERHTCTDPLFYPALMGKDEKGLHEAILSAFQALDPTRSEVKHFSNLIFAGGTSMLPGIKERLQRELLPLLPPEISPSYTLLPNRKYLPWFGASLISSMSNFGQPTYTMEEYEESGPSLVHNKIY